MTEAAVLDEGTMVLLLPAFTIMGLLWAGYELWQRGQDHAPALKIATKSGRTRTRAMPLKQRSSLLDTHGNVILLWRVCAELHASSPQYPKAVILQKPDGRGSLDHPNTLGWINFVFVLALLGIFNEFALNFMKLGSLLNAERKFMETPAQVIRIQYFAEYRMYSNIVFGAHQLFPAFAVMTGVFLMGYPVLRWSRGHEWSVASRVLQYSLVLGLLLGSVAYTRSEHAAEFPFTHKATVLMHACVLCMKLHSYLEVNREFAMINAGVWRPSHMLVRQPTPVHANVHVDEAGDDIRKQWPEASTDGPTDNSSGLPAATSIADDVKRRLPRSGAASRQRSRSKSRSSMRSGPRQAQAAAGDASSANTSHGPLSTGVQSEMKTASLSLHSTTQASDTERDNQDDHDQIGCCSRRGTQFNDVVEQFTHLDVAWTAANALDFARNLVAPGASVAQDGVTSQARKGRTEDWDPEEELHHVYPNNVTLYDLMVFLCMPILVYSPKYPRTLSVNWAYIAEKLLLAVGTLTICVILTANYVAPVLEHAAQIHPVEAIVRTIIPFCLLWLAFFYIVFECVCNGWAELTRLGDRAFYSNWWDSTTFTYFSRTWNRPVHEWLLKHCYIAAQNAGLKASQAQYITFGISILVHELVINGMFGFISPWLLLFSCFQFPLMSIMRASVFKGKRLGNLVFWIGLILGVPLISVLYSREYCIRHPDACASSG